MLLLSTEFYAKRVHLRLTGVIAIRKIASVEDDRLETEVRSASSRLDAVDSHEVQYLMRF
jgi:hypothetical protein